MDSGWPPRAAPSYAAGRAAYRGETSSSSSALRPPPQQQHGQAIPPVPPRQASLPVDHGADAFPFELESPERRMEELYLRDSRRRVRVDASSGSLPSPRDRSAVYGYDYDSAHPTPPHLRVHNDEATRGGASSSTQQEPGPMIPPLHPHPQFGAPHHLYGRSETSSSGAAPVGTARPSAVDLFYGRSEPSTVDAADAHRFAGKFYLPPSEAALAAIAHRRRLAPAPPNNSTAPTTRSAATARSPPQSPASTSTRWPKASSSGQQPLLQQRYAPQAWPQPPQRYARDETRSSHSGRPEPPIRQDSRLEEIRSESLRSPMTLEQVMSCSAFVVQLLEQGDEKMRHKVLDWFVHRAHEIMGNRQGHAVFATLLRICRWRHEELCSIVEAAFTPNLGLRSDDWVTSVRMLIAEVARYPDLSERLVGSFVRERVMDEAGGDELIAHCFATMPYEVTRALIRHALDTINDKLDSEFGSRCVSVCFRKAQADDLQNFNNVVCEGAIEIAMGQYSNYLMQDVLEHGDIGVQYAVVDQLKTEVANLCCHQYGHYVVQSCFLKTGDCRGELLRRLVQALQELCDTQLAGLVQNAFASRVLSRLLHTAGTRRFRKERWGWELAQRIRRASAAHLGLDLENTNTKRVMKSIDRMEM
ncbi:hypothetical protein ZWY2020_007327 [Hordeum vulgare]|nr:hypothetical protein ZWY2020_007327 [Hordeum vulgare]